METIGTKLSEHQRFEPKETKKASALKELREMVFGIMLGAVLLGGVKRGSEAVFDVKYEQQYSTLKRLEGKEKKIKQLYGENFPYNLSGYYETRLEQKRKEAVPNLGLLFGQKPEEFTDASWGPSETLETPKTEVSSINTGEGTIGKEFIGKIVHETYPNGWVNNQVSRIVQSSEKNNKTYKGVGSGALASFSKPEPSNLNDRGKITFWKISESVNPNYIVRSVGHEIGHSNDWESDKEMTAEQRVDLLLRISGRLDAKDRYQSSYVESIEDDDPQKQSYYKATEYWAEICAQYFDDATKLNIKDFRIVDQQVRRTDANFNWKKSSFKRTGLLNDGLGRRKPPEPPTVITEIITEQSETIAEQNYDSSNQQQARQ